MLGFRMWCLRGGLKHGTSNSPQNDLGCYIGRCVWVLTFGGLGVEA